MLNNKYNIKKTCPDGDRYCGTKVWKISLEEMKRLI